MSKVPFQIFKLLFPKDRIIGLDIGSSTIKLAEFFYQEGKLTLCKLKLQEVDLQKDGFQARLEALKNLFEDINLQQVKINVVINSAQSYTLIRTIPYMPKSEIAQALKWEIKNYIPFSVDEAILDYEIMGEVIERSSKKLKLAVACLPKAIIDNYVALFAQAGVGVHLFTQPAFALKNVIDKLFSKDDKTVAMLDIGYNFSELFIFQDQQLCFSRKLPIAGQNFTEDLTQTLVSNLGKIKLSLQEAENIKRRYGIPDANAAEVLDGKMSSAQLVSLIRPNLEKLIEEIERSFDFYHEKNQEAKVERLILLGAGSQLKGLVKTLKNNLGIPVELSNPLKEMSTDKSALSKENLYSAHIFTQALGAALASEGAINILPVEIKEQTKLLIKRSSVKAVVTAIIVILILTYTGLKIGIGAYDQRINAAKLELNALMLQAEQLQKYLFLSDITRQRIYWSDILKEIGNRIPKQIRLAQLEAKKSSLILKGEIKSSTKTYEKVLTEFMNSLENSIFKEVSLVMTKEGVSANEPYRFELSLKVE
jgi:type IV pilus assembly protein PilM